MHEAELAYNSWKQQHKNPCDIPELQVAATEVDIATHKVKLFASKSVMNEIYDRKTRSEDFGMYIHKISDKMLEDLEKYRACIKLSNALEVSTLLMHSN